MRHNRVLRDGAESQGAKSQGAEFKGAKRHCAEFHDAECTIVPNSNVPKCQSVKLLNRQIV
jgi:hypothetical protein